MMKFDDILVEIGEFGPYQKRIFLIASMVCMMCGYQVFAVVFLLNIPAHRCAVPGYDNDTFATQNPFHEYLVNLTIPLVENGKGETTYSTCYLYNVTTHNPGDNFSQYECESWVYDKTVMDNTVISEFNVVCKSEIFRSVVNMVGFVGSTLGSLVLGLLSDIIGRKKSLMLTAALGVVVGSAIALSPSYLFYAAMSFLFGFSAVGLYMLPFTITVSSLYPISFPFFPNDSSAEIIANQWLVSPLMTRKLLDSFVKRPPITSKIMNYLVLYIVMEIVGPNKRTTLGVSGPFFFAAGMLPLSLVAYLIREWRMLRLALGLPLVLSISLWWLIPESPRWLLSKRKCDEANKIIRKIAMSNKVQIDDKTLEKLTADTKEKSLSFWHLFLSPKILLRSLILYFSLFSISLAYFGLAFNVSNLSGNIYLNFFLTAMAEICACGLTLCLLYRAGRRRILVPAMVVGGIGCLAAIFPALYGSEATDWTLIVISTVGRFGASVSFAIADIYSVELFPTVVRQSGMAASRIFVCLGGMVAPYIADLGILIGGGLSDTLPMIVFGSLSVAAGLLDCFLPETRNRALPETIQDSVNYGTKKNNSQRAPETGQQNQEDEITRM